MNEPATSHEGGMYIHIPFCKQACHYCNFHFSTSLHYKSEIVAALCKEIELKAISNIPFTIHSIYFGGGTPSLLTKNEIAKILDKVNSSFKVTPDAEITLEANPDDITKESIELYLGQGINRLSIGVQSLTDEHLRWMNRSHNAIQARTAIRQTMDAGITNLNIDLIFGIPGLTDDQLTQYIEFIKENEIPHVSAYNLTVEEQTMLNKKIRQGEIILPGEDKNVTEYLLIHLLLTENGYQHYEISNYALKGMESRHNKAYWEGKPYIGIGPSAHSYDGQKRSWNIANNQKYIRSINENKLPEDSEIINNETRFNEWLMTRLRTAVGISEEQLLHQEQSLISHFKKKSYTFIQQGDIIYNNGHYKLTPESWMISDHIISSLFI